MINEPFVLASYSTTRRASNALGIYTSYEKSTQNSDGFVSVVAQSDGVHVLDVSTLHPIISYTLGPSTTFACSPLTHHLPSENTHRIYAVIASSPDIKQDQQGQVLWRWTENLTSPVAEHASSSSNTEHHTLVVPHLVCFLRNCDGLPERILAISPTGDISVITSDLELKTTYQQPDTSKIEVLNLFTFSKDSCLFAKSLGTSMEGSVVVLLVGVGSHTQIRTHIVNPEDTITLVNTAELNISPADIVASSCSSMGFLNVICRDGLWYSYSMTSLSQDLDLATPSSSTQLSGLSFITPPETNKVQGKTGKSRTHTPLSLLALTSSYILLASITPQNEIALLLWDTQYSVLLASHALALPSSINDRSSSLTLCLLSPGGGPMKPGNQQAILTLSQPTAEADPKSPVKSTVYVVPYNVPAQSTLANAIGRRNAGKRWIAGNKGAADKEFPRDAARVKLVTKMKMAVEQNRPQAATALFNEWEKDEQGKFEQGLVKSMGLDYTFVKDTLEALIQPQNPPSPLYSSDVVRNLIDRGVVRSSMLEGGLLGTLRARNDWPSIDLALRCVPDITENELVETLNIVANHHLMVSSSATNVDAIQVDEAILTPTSLSDFMASILKHWAFTAPQLVVALRRSLRSAEAITAIGKILDQWIKKSQLQEIKLLPSKKDITKNEHGAVIFKPENIKPKPSDLPPIEKILGFLVSLLDASFLILLQYPPAYSVLKNLKAHIEPEISTLSQTEQLRGLIGGFANAHAKAIADAEAGKTKAGAGREDKRDWRQRRREMHEQGMAVGAYQLEELTL